jgi:hypothetical protein
MVRGTGGEELIPGREGGRKIRENSASEEKLFAVPRS